MKKVEHERQDWIVIIIILVIGLLCVIVAGQLALRLSPSWQLNTDMDSRLDPNSALLTRAPGEFVEALDPSILTQPSWLEVFLTPGASFVTRTPHPAVTRTPSPAPTIAASATNPVATAASPTNTFVYFLPTWTVTPRPAPTTTDVVPTSPPTATPSTVASPAPSPTHTQPPTADLLITKNDSASTYVADGTLTYVITVSNAGPSDITGAVVTDNLPSQITNWTWTCTVQSGGANACDGMSGNTNFVDTVNLPNGGQIEYTVAASVSPGASGDLNNVASVSLPAGFTDPAPLDNLATDTDQLLVSAPFPSDNIGNTEDGATTTVPPGSSVVLTFDTPLTVGTHPGYDLVYYELAAGIGIQMDHVVLQVSDGYNWYTIFNWGDDIADTNANLNIGNPVVGGNETDNRDIDSVLLYNSTGVAIDLDGVVPDGTYSYIRIFSPLGEDGDGCDVDAIVILP